MVKAKNRRGKRNARAKLAIGSIIPYTILCLRASSLAYEIFCLTADKTMALPLF